MSEADEMLERVATLRRCYYSMLSIANSPRSEKGTVSCTDLLMLAGFAKARVEIVDPDLEMIWDACSDSATTVFADLPSYRSIDPEIQHWLNMAAMLSMLTEEQSGELWKLAKFYLPKGIGIV